MKLSTKVNVIQLSPTIKIADKVRELEQRGKKIIRLETGEPHFATPDTIVEAACKALKKGQTHYSHSRGIYELRTALCEFFDSFAGVSFDPDKNILITPG